MVENIQNTEEIPQFVDMSEVSDVITNASIEMQEEQESIEKLERAKLMEKFQ